MSHDYDQKRGFIFRSIENGDFLPRVEDIKDFKNFDEKSESQKKEMVTRLYEWARRGVRYTDMAFCMCDILGFSSRILNEKGSLLRFYSDIVIPLLEAGIKEGKFASDFVRAAFSSVPKEISVDGSKALSDPPCIEVLTFADTIVMYPVTSSKTHQFYSLPIIQILLLNWAARYLFVEMMKRRVLLRGSISFGECLISRDPISYLGTTIIEAHATETIQNWGGLMFAPSAAKYIENFNRPIHGIEKHVVPIKQDRSSLALYRKLFPDSNFNNYVMDWTLLIDLDLTNIDWIRKESKNMKLKPNVRNLYKNTMKFYDSMSAMRAQIRDLLS